MSYYHRCLQKHLFFHGTDLRLLSKNPSFTPFIESLTKEFPDASYIACVRRPEEVVPSQLNSLRPAMRSLANGRCNNLFESKLVAILYSYYLTVEEKNNNENFKVLPLHDLKNSLKDSILLLFDFLKMPVSDNFNTVLNEHDVEAKAYHSQFQLQPKSLDVNAIMIQQKFRLVWPLSDQV